MIEAICLTCRESYKPHALTDDELEHFQREDGTLCGGRGLPVSTIVEKYHEIAAHNGALGVLAAAEESDLPEIVYEFLDVAHDVVTELGLDSLDDVDTVDLFVIFQPVARTYLARVRTSRFVKKTLVVRLPVLVDPEKLNGNAAPEPIIVEGIRSAVATIPFLELDDVPSTPSLPTMLAVSLEDRRS